LRFIFAHTYMKKCNMFNILSFDKYEMYLSKSDMSRNRFNIFLTKIICQIIPYDVSLIKIKHMQIVKQPPRIKKSPAISDNEISTLLSSRAEVIETVATEDNVAKVCKIWVNPEYNESSKLFSPEKTLKEWCDIKGIEIESISNYDADRDVIKDSSSSITRVHIPKVSNGTNVCIITLGDFTKHKQMITSIAYQTRLYFAKHEGFLPEGIQQREKDMPATSYYSMLSCAPENVEKLKQFIKMNILVAKVKWL